MNPSNSRKFGIRSMGGLTSFFNLKETKMSQVAQAKKTITIQVEVGEPEEVATGVFRTSLKHPALDGTLTLVHNTNGREVMLENLAAEESEVDVVEAVGKLIKVAKDSGLFKGLGNKTPK